MTYFHFQIYDPFRLIEQAYKVLLYFSLEVHLTILQLVETGT